MPRIRGRLHVSQGRNARSKDSNFSRNENQEWTAAVSNAYSPRSYQPPLVSATLVSEALVILSEAKDLCNRPRVHRSFASLRKTKVCALFINTQKLSPGIPRQQKLLAASAGKKDSFTVCKYSSPDGNCASRTSNLSGRAHDP